MLILSRREMESICLGDDIVLTIVAVGKDKVRIGVNAPPGVRILRQELEVDASATNQPLAFPQPERKQVDKSMESPIHRRRVA